MNVDLPYELYESIKDKKLLVFVGAGISKMAGIPLWKDIVVKTFSGPSIKKGTEYIAALNSEIISPLEALDKIKETNKRDVYSCFQTETSKLLKHDIYQKISSISKKIITTNYDNLIEHNTNIETIDTASTYSLQKIDQSDEFILKIHGTSSSIDNAIIFTDDYKKLYESDNGLAKFQFEKIVSSHSCLFLGFSMSDNYIVKLFDRLHAMYDGIGRKHFSISTTNIDHDFLENIEIGSYDELPMLLDHILKEGSINDPSGIANDDDGLISDSLDASSPSLSIPDEGIKVNPGHDTPPKIEHWAGRNEEIKSLMISHKVCFITGIGGQGKSALASKVLSETDRSKSRFFDWRDFKEEDLNLQSKLFQLIELVSNGEMLTRDLVGLETENLIDLFFEKLGAQNGVFVFDNIDKYIDLEKFTPSGEMGVFFNKALKSPHNAKFIFTCRPFIHYAGIGFYQVKLEGLEVDDVKELIKIYHGKLSNDDLQRLAIRLHRATGGHPLWMGLILAQSRVDVSHIDLLITKIEDKNSHGSVGDISGLIAETVLENAWEGLKDRERVVLRVLSISSISESEEDLAKIVSKKLNYKQFSKAIKTLKSLNLVVPKEGKGHIELHPLVREFIKANYGREEQESYIALYVSYLDGFIVLIKNKFGMALGQEDLDVIIKKIEILINTDKIQEAINEMRSTGDSFQISGYCEEFLRLADILLNKNIWTFKRLSEIRGFFEFIHMAFSRMSEFGRHDMFSVHIEKYLRIFSAADTNMILAKSAICHNEWSSGNFQKAIIEGKSASDLIDVTEDKDHWLGKHRYHLALRDSKIPDNVVKAMEYFCEGGSLDSISNNECLPDKASAYGNIGRCLIYLDRVSEALFLTVKSYRSLNKGKKNFFHAHNLGYAAKWLGEILFENGRQQEALYFFIYARNIWKNDMPAEANKIEAFINQQSITISTQSIVSLESWQISKYCDDWVESYYIDAIKSQ